MALFLVASCGLLKSGIHLNAILAVGDRLSVARRLLREEREKLGFSQEKFGMAGGVKKWRRSTMSGGVQPGCQLSGCCCTGGSRCVTSSRASGGGSQLLALSQEEQTMLDRMRQASLVLRRVALSVLLSGQPSAGSTQPESRQPSVPEPSRQPARCPDDVTSVAFRTESCATGS